MADLEPFINEKRIDIYYEKVLLIISSAVQVILKGAYSLLRGLNDLLSFVESCQDYTEIVHLCIKTY